MATKRITSEGATFSGEPWSPDNGEWAGAREVGAQRPASEFDQRRGRQPRPQLHVAGAGLTLPLHGPNEHMHAANGAMADYGNGAGDSALDGNGAGDSALDGNGARQCGGQFRPRRSREQIRRAWDAAQAPCLQTPKGRTAQALIIR